MTITRDGQEAEVAGLGQPATMRAWLIQALTGRRASEILLMDFDPLSPVPGINPAEVPEGGMVARLRYQQTKVDGAPKTILVGADVAEIVREQQEWVRQRWNLGPQGTARYLFPRLTGNRHATRPWETGHYNMVLRQFSRAPGLRDTDGHVLSYSRSHRLRHTKATTLLNAGAPIHVVQRYLGHRSPEMTMRYAATLASTAEREFLAMVKIGRDGRRSAWTAATCSTCSSSTGALTGCCPTGTACCPRSGPATRATPATAAATSPPTAATFGRSAASSPKPSS